MDLHTVFILLGAIFLIGLVADQVGHRTKVPRVTLLLLIGVAIGPTGFDLLPEGAAALYEFLAATALTMVAFLLGNALSLDRLKRHGREILIVSCVVVGVSLAVVGVGLAVFGVPLVLALILAAISTATAPAATMDVVNQEKARGPFPELLLGIVAVDDAWGLIAFSLMLILAKGIAGDGAVSVVQLGLWELGGATAIGLGLGVPAAYLTGRIRAGEPMQTEALGVVFLCAGLAIWMEVSFLLAGIIAGVTIANTARHHERAFHEIEQIEWPFMLLFFVLAGASFHADEATGMTFVVILCVVLRTAARIIGGWVGGTLANLKQRERGWIGSALLPQAGVAVGMALVAGDHFPEYKEAIISVTIATTIVFEIFGPLATMAALRRTGSVD